MEATTRTVAELAMSPSVEAPFPPQDIAIMVSPIAAKETIM
jgi:hypothetical protein